MWQSIKKFFKRIADCTGISWIARKISSGWNSVKNWWSGNKVSNADPSKAETPEEPGIPVNEPSITNEPSPAKPEPVIGSICENKGELELFVESNYISKILGGDLGIANNADLNFTEILDKLKYRAYIRCDAGIFKITCDKLIKDNNSRSNDTFLSIESIASQDGEDSSSELEKMKNMLGLSEKHAVASITQVSKGPITVPKVVANSNPSSGMTNSGTLAANGNQLVRS